jgi:hypothetical protein
MRERINKYKKEKSDEEFAKVVWKEKDFYLSVNPYNLSLNKFKALPEDLKNKYIGFGLGLSDEMFDLIKSNKNLVKRYKEISERKVENKLDLNNTEFLVCSDEIKNKYISNKIEKGDGISSEEFQFCDHEVKKLYIEKGYSVSDEHFELCDNELKKLYIQKLDLKTKNFSLTQFKLLNDELKKLFIDKAIEFEMSGPGNQWYGISPDIYNSNLLKYYLDKKIESNLDLSRREVEILSDELKDYFIEKMAKMGKNLNVFSNYFLKQIYDENITKFQIYSKELKYQILRYFKDSNKRLQGEFFMYDFFDHLSVDLKEFVLKEFDLDFAHLSSKSFRQLPDELKRIYLERGKNFGQEQLNWKEKNM